MKVAGKVAVVTGGGGGIGSALASRLVAADARVVIADLDADAAAAAAERANAGHRDRCVAADGSVDASDPADIEGLIGLAEERFGPVDLYFANAGVTGAPGLEATDDDWDVVIDVNLRAHVRAARLLVPKWVRRGGGYFVSTASAAGLLTQIGGLAYAVTKHAAVAFAEWLAITYGDAGVRVSCLCPMGVNTTLLYAATNADDPVGRAATAAVTAAGAVLEPETVADITLRAIDAEEFLILPHPEVVEMYRQKGADYDRWLRGMRRYQRSVFAGGKRAGG